MTGSLKAGTMLGTIVAAGFTPDQARCEAARCLRCFANIILDVDKCVLCGLCADVCPVDVISFVPSEEVEPGVSGGTASPPVEPSGIPRFDTFWRQGAPAQ